MKKALLLNQSHTSNLGDKVIGTSLTQMISGCGFEVVLKSFAEKVDVGTVECAAETENASNPEKSKIKSYIKNSKIAKTLKFDSLWRMIKLNKLYFFLNNWQNFSSTHGCDVIFIGGGQLGRNNYNFSLCMLLWCLLAKIKNIKIYAVSIGFDDEFSFINKLFFKAALNCFEQVYVRDHRSKNNLSKISSVSVSVIKDSAFIMRYVFPAEPKGNYILVCPACYDSVYKIHNKNVEITYDSYIDWYKEEIKKEAARLGCNKIIILPSDIEYDERESLLLMESLKDTFECEMRYAYDVEGFCSAISAASSVISGRMHPMIIGISYGVNVVPHFVNDKVIGFYDEIRKNPVDVSEIHGSYQDVFTNVMNRVK